MLKPFSLLFNFKISFILSNEIKLGTTTSKKKRKELEEASLMNIKKKSNRSPLSSKASIQRILLSMDSFRSKIGVRHFFFLVDILN